MLATTVEISNSKLVNNRLCYPKTTKASAESLFKLSVSSNNLTPDGKSKQLKRSSDERINEFDWTNGQVKTETILLKRKRFK